MSRKDPLPEELVELERSLARLTPVSRGLDRDQLMFAAGAASVSSPASGSRESCTRKPTTRGDKIRQRERSWISAGSIATAASTLAACVFATLYVGECLRSPRTIREIVTVDRVVSTPIAPVVPSEETVKGRRVPQVILRNKTRPDGALSRRSIAGSDGTAASYLRLRQIALTRGVEALPRREYVGPAGPPTSLQTANELLKELLPAAAYSREPRNG